MVKILKKRASLRWSFQRGGLHSQIWITEHFYANELKTEDAKKMPVHVTLNPGEGDVMF